MSTPTPPLKTVGVFEAVSFPNLSKKTVIAKLDTGAYSGALHCSSIRLVKSSQGVVLEFYPLDEAAPLVFDEFAVRYVKSSNGQRQKRYFIDTDVVLSGKKYPVLLSLTDRSSMKWKVLLGRKFMKQYGIIVDANKPSSYGKSTSKS